MEDGTGARAFLAKAAAAFTVLSLLPVALSGSAPSHASAVLRPISGFDLRTSVADNTVATTPLFATFHYDRGQVSGTYVQFVYNASTGSVKSLLGLEGETPVLYIGSIDIQGFVPFAAPTTRGPIFEASGNFVGITAHDDPTALFEIRADSPRSVTIDLPASAANISLHSTPGAWPTSIVTYTVGGEQARLLLGTGMFSLAGTHILAMMGGSDLLVFKAVPVASANKAEWRAVLDAISAGALVAELDLMATADGSWMQNTARYRIDVIAWPVAVQPRKASVRVESVPLETAGIPSVSAPGAVILLAFDEDTMPARDAAQLIVRANGSVVNRTADVLSLFYAPDVRTKDPVYTLLPLPGTVLAVYLPSLDSTSIEVASVFLPRPGPTFEPGSEVAVVAALALVSLAAAHMFRRRED